MCGIAGIYSLSDRAVDPFAIGRLCEAQAHRGPDDAGSVLLLPVRGQSGPRWWEPTAHDLSRAMPDLETRGLGQAGSPGGKRAYRLALGHRRLAVLDLSLAGHQPMTNRSRTVWLTYNGEIYNHLELKKELMEKGYEFFSTTDTEVILHLYEEFGAACVERLNGMFAFAIWDDPRETLLLARDRYGIKPLYYGEFAGYLVFASEVKAILSMQGASRQVNVPALVDYFTFQNTFGEQTLFQGVHLLEPGHTITIQDGRIERRRYWDFNFGPQEDLTEERCRERLRFLLEDTIKRQLVSDVPVGAYLSGGMDSGSITALAANSIPRLMTFTGGFDLTNVSGFEAGFDERKDAEVLSALLKTEHYQMVFHAGDLEWALPRVIWAIEDLRVGMCYPYYYTARLASQFVKVVLAGTGGDEIFAGYPWRYKAVAAASSFEAFLSGYFSYWNRLVPVAQQAGFFTPDLLRQASGHHPYDTFRTVAQGANGLGEPILSVSVVPVALTEFSKRHLVRELAAEECRAALATVDRFAARAVTGRGFPWCFGADELYLGAGAPLPTPDWYGDFDQRENGVGSVRYLQMRIAAARDRLADFRGRRIGVVTGTAMRSLMPMVVEDLVRATGAHYEIIVVENTLFGVSVTTAGLLPARAIAAALQPQHDLDLALLPAEAVNDDLIFMDDVSADDLVARVPFPVRLSYDFADVLSECGVRSAGCGIARGGRLRHDVHIDTPHSAFRIPHFGVGDRP